MVVVVELGFVLFHCLCLCPAVMRAVKIPLVSLAAAGGKRSREMYCRLVLCLRFLVLSLCLCLCFLQRVLLVVPFLCFVVMVIAIASRRRTVWSASTPSQSRVEDGVMGRCLGRHWSAGGGVV